MARAASVGILKKALISYRGKTTTDGNVGGTTLVCSALSTKPDFNNNLVVVLTGDYAGQSRDISASTTGGTITVSSAFGGRIVSGVSFIILSSKPAAAEVTDIKGAGFVAGTDSLKALSDRQQAIEAKTDNLPTDPADESLLEAAIATRAPESGGNIAAIKARTDKLAGGEADTEIANRNLFAGVATSGATGADILTITTTTRTKVHMLMVSMVNCTALATITVRMYTEVNGVEVEFYNQDFTKDTDPDGLMVINGTLAILADLRVEMQSSDGADTAVTVPYSHITEDME